MVKRINLARSELVFYLCLLVVLVVWQFEGELPVAAQEHLQWLVDSIGIVTGCVALYDRTKTKKD